MIYTLSNTILNIKVNSMGAELKSVVDQRTGFEFMWQADPTVWGRTSPVLFPIVGKLKNNTYSFDGTDYTLMQHGFARDLEFEYVSGEESSLTMRLTSTPETMSSYPFDFELIIHYELNEHEITVNWMVTNTDQQALYFSIGAHPGFNLIEGRMDQYELVFSSDESITRWLLTDGMLNGETRILNMPNRKLLLSPNLFTEDAIVIKGLQSETIQINHLKSNHRIDVRSEDFPFMGIWSKKGCEEFICIEPWCGIADSIIGTHDLKNKEGILSLSPKHTLEKKYHMKFSV